jgi:hypothetical protein
MKDYIAIQKPGEDSYTWLKRPSSGTSSVYKPEDQVSSVTYQATGRYLTRADGVKAEIFVPKPPPFDARAVPTYPGLGRGLSGWCYGEPVTDYKTIKPGDLLIRDEHQFFTTNLHRVVSVSDGSNIVRDGSEGIDTRYADYDTSEAARMHFWPHDLTSNVETWYRAVPTAPAPYHDISVSEDGVWMRFRTQDGSEAAINLEALKDEATVVGTILLRWCKELRQSQHEAEKSKV